MKKLTTFLFIILVSLSFSACGTASNENTEINSEITFNYSGVLSRIESGSSLKGTHIITNEEGETAIRSALFDLSSRAYLGNRVQVFGKKDSDGVLNVDSILLIEKIEQEDESNELVTFEDSDWGVKFDHPSWNVENGPELILSSEDGLTVTKHRGFLMMKFQNWKVMLGLSLLSHNTLNCKVAKQMNQASLSSLVKID